MSEIQPRIPDPEKITVHLGYVDLGQIDLLVGGGFYSNRTDFIQTAIRNQLDRQNEVVRQSVARHRLDLGLRHYTGADLEEVLARGEQLHIPVLGLAVIAPDVTPDLSRAAIARIHVRGAVSAPAAVKEALADRIG